MDRLLLERKSLCSGRPSYPYFGESLLAVFLTIIIHGVINHLTMLQNSGVATKKELRSNGYPLPVWENGEFIRVLLIFTLFCWSMSLQLPSTTESLLLLPVGMRLLNNFEEKFSEDIWGKLERNVASNMSQSVVALASFSGNYIHYKLVYFQY